MSLGRPSPRTALLLSAALLAAVALATSCRTGLAPQVPTAPIASTPAQAPGQVRHAEDFVTSPAVRVGVVIDAPRASIGAELAGVVVSELGPAAGASRQWTVPRASFVAIKRANGAGALRFVETGDEIDAVLVTPEAVKEQLSVDASPYRGVLEVRGDGNGALTVVDVLNLEDYLRGVVPNELSPQSFPELEALKAQAVAARTYALRNLGQYKAKGYDLCATPTCQVYKGRSSEQPLSDQAVQDTAGVVAEYGGSLINALYTSTCGGHTEDGVNIFEGEPQPWLKGVPCAPERGEWARLRTTASREPLGPEEGLNRDASLLAALGVLEPALLSPRAMKAPLSEAEARDWTARLLKSLRRKACDANVDPPLARRASFFQHVVGSLCWEERARRLLGPADSDYLLQAEDRGGFSPPERMAAALLLREGALAPFADNTLRPVSVITRAQATSLLARVALRAGPPALLSGELRRAEGDHVTLERSEGEETLAVDAAARLFRALDGRPAAVSELLAVPGDAVRYVVRDGRIAYLEAEQPRAGAASDRSSRYYGWEMRLTPEDVAKGIARYGSVGRVREVSPRRIGVSGRVVELNVLGSDGELALRGLRIRWALGLRENLFVVDRELTSQGAVARFIFTGKGWGHGVGLCQVGAYGMAKAGARFDEILKHYYTGIALRQAAAR